MLYEHHNLTLKKKKLPKGILKRRRMRKARLQSIERDAMKDRKVEYKIFRSLNHIEVNSSSVYFSSHLTLLACLIIDGPEISIT